MQTVKLDFPDRDLYILADGDWRGYRSHPCAKEPETVEWIRDMRPMREQELVFWDIGASVGPYSLIAEYYGFTVDAFEPFAPSYGHLWQNIWLNSAHGIEAYPIALSTFEGFEDFGIADTVPGSASHVSGRYSQWTQYSSVDACTEFVSPPNHVKIDVDGAELGVIEGGRQTWKKVDSIMVESEPPTVDDITVILADAGLELVESWPRMGETKQRNYLYRRSGK